MDIYVHPWTPMEARRECLGVFSRSQPYSSETDESPLNLSCMWSVSVRLVASTPRSLCVSSALSWQGSWLFIWFWKCEFRSLCFCIVWLVLVNLTQIRVIQEEGTLWNQLHEIGLWAWLIMGVGGAITLWAVPPWGKKASWLSHRKWATEQISPWSLFQILHEFLP